MEFLRKYFYPPVNVEPRNRCFSPEHIIISSILIIFLITILVIIIKENKAELTNRVLLVSACLLAALEIFRIGWNAYFKGFSLSNFRFDFCNQLCMALPLIIIFKQKKLYPYVDLLAILGGLTVLIYPLWVFYDYAGFHLMALQSMISHALMVLCGLLMPLACKEIGSVRETFSKSLKGFLLIFVISFIMAHVTGDNYLLAFSADGVPFIENIPYPYYFPVVFVIVCIAIYLSSLLYCKFESNIIYKVNKKVIYDH